MHISFVLFGYGFCLNIGTYNIDWNGKIILQWSLLKRNTVWRGETHSRSDHAYNYRCIKNGETVEDVSFRSPVVNHL